MAVVGSQSGLKPDAPLPANADEDAGLRRTVRRQRILLIVAIMAVLVAAGGLVASLWIKSPAQVAADTAPPAPTVITAPVQRRVLTSTVVLRGSVFPGREYQVTPSPPAGSDLAVITAAPVRAGENVSAGQVIVEVSGRPVVALPGAFPAYRDLALGSSGPDVMQLQKALRGLGFGIGSDKSGSYGKGTGTAAQALFTKLGYALPRGKDGVPEIPLSEVLFLPAFPATLTSLSGHVGDVVAAPLLTLTTGDLVLTGQLDPSQKNLVRPGMTVDILAEATGATATGVVGSLGQPTSTPASGDVITIGSGSLSAQGDGVGGGGAGGPRYVPLNVTTVKPLAASFAGQDVRLQVQTASTGSPVLVVPASAISTTSGNRQQVTVVGKDGSQRGVSVTVGASAGGYVQVTSTRGALEPGMSVAVGQ